MSLTSYRTAPPRVNSFVMGTVRVPFSFDRLRTFGPSAGRTAPPRVNCFLGPPGSGGGFAPGFEIKGRQRPPLGFIHHCEMFDPGSQSGPGTFTLALGPCAWPLRLAPALGRTGGDLLSHALRRSTIGAEGFHGRVRDGIGCMPLAVTTRPSKRTGLTGPAPPIGKWEGGVGSGFGWFFACVPCMS